MYMVGGGRMSSVFCGGCLPAAWDESGDETLDESEASDIMTGPKEFSRSYDPTQPSADVLARRRSSVQRTASPQTSKGSTEVGGWSVCALCVAEIGTEPPVLCDVHAVLQRPGGVSSTEGVLAASRHGQVLESLRS